MNINDEIKHLKDVFNNAMRELPAIISHEFGTIERDEEAETIDIEVNLTMKWGNIKREHTITLSYSECEIGINLMTEDGDIAEINPASIMTQLYFDLAMAGIDDEYLR